MRVNEEEKKNSIITFLTDKGIDGKKAKTILVDAEKIAEEELGKKKDNFSSNDWAYVMGIVKRMAGMKEKSVVKKSLIDKFLESDMSAGELIDEMVTSGDIADTLGMSTVDVEPDEEKEGCKRKVKEVSMRVIKEGKKLHEKRVDYNDVNLEDLAYYLYNDIDGGIGTDNYGKDFEWMISTDRDSLSDKDYYKIADQLENGYTKGKVKGVAWSLEMDY
jgi:hypothetical protein